MRCFISIDLPREVREELASVQEKLPEAKMTLVKPDVIHLTLKFLGELSEKEVDDVKSSLKEISFTKFKAKLGEVGVFPNSSFVRVVYVGIEPKEKIGELHDLIDGSLKNLGFNLDKGFESHATLSRVKLLKDKKAFLDKLSKIRTKPLEFNVSKFSLMGSTLTSNGPIYKEIMSFDLN